jgi:hypothetical protein
MRTSFFLVSLLVSAVALAQSNTDKSFGASGASCDQVNWSDAALAKYPQIGKACQAVVERDGKTYLKFEAEVRKVAKKGEELTVAFKDGQTSVLTPPPDFAVKINDKPVPAKDLRPGDKLTFYVMQDRLAAANEELATLLFIVILPEPAVPADALAQTSAADGSGANTAAAAADTASESAAAPAAADSAAAEATAPEAAAPAASAPPPIWLAFLIALALIALLVFLDKRKPSGSAH